MKKEVYSIRKRLILCCFHSVLLISFMWLAGCQTDETEIAAQDGDAFSSVEADTDTADLEADEDQPTIFAAEPYEGLLTLRYVYLDDTDHAGEAIIIQSPDGKTMMIDAGTPDVAPQVLSHLEQLGIEKIDIAVNSHIHSDHIGGFIDIFRKYPVDQFYMADFPESPWSIHREAMYQVELRQIKTDYLEAGDRFQLGEEVEIEVLNPGQGELPDAISTFELEEVNNASLVLLMTYKDHRFLFTGDIHTSRQLDLIEKYGDHLQANFMDAPHHGYGDAAASSFIRTVQPQYAVMSVNHALNFQTMLKYQKEKVEVFATDLHGSVLIISDGHKLNAITETSPNN